MTTKNNYLLKAHEIFFQRTVELNNEVKALSKRLSPDELREHETVKFAHKVYKATLETIPEHPDHPAYRLHADLKKYRRYKQGLGRYRLFFAFSTTPKIILYLYLNDRASLRKEGDKNDPYERFRRFVRQGRVSHDPLEMKKRANMPRSQRGRRFRAALQAVNRRHRRTLQHLASVSPDFRSSGDTIPNSAR